MKRRFIVLLGTAVVSAVAVFIVVSGSSTNTNNFKVESSDIQDDGILTQSQVFDGFGCTGKNIAPALRWSGAPEGTKSFAITVYDPDAPTGSGWWHWLVVNLPATVNNLPATSGQTGGIPLPAGSVQTRTDFGKAEFGGACPPVGDKPHRYQFTVWALKVDKLDVTPDASGAMVGFALNANVLDKAVLTAEYGR